MKTRFILLVLCSMIVNSIATAQEFEHFSRIDTHSGQDDNGSWRVTIEYDADGQVIAYDSSYTRSGSQTAFSRDDHYNDIETFRRRMDSEFESLFNDDSDIAPGDSSYSRPFSQKFFSDEGWKERVEDLNKFFEEFRKKQERFLNEHFYKSDEKKDEADQIDSSYPSRDM